MQKLASKQDFIVYSSPYLVQVKMNVNFSSFSTKNKPKIWPQIFFRGPQLTRKITKKIIFKDGIRLGLDIRLGIR